jgi:hypothetical protein
MWERGRERRERWIERKKEGYQETGGGKGGRIMYCGSVTLYFSTEKANPPQSLRWMTGGW